MLSVCEFYRVPPHACDPERVLKHGAKGTVSRRVQIKFVAITHHMDRLLTFKGQLGPGSALQKLSPMFPQVEATVYNPINKIATATQTISSSAVQMTSCTWPSLIMVKICLKSPSSS